MANTNYGVNRETILKFNTANYGKHFNLTEQEKLLKEKDNIIANLRNKLEKSQKENKELIKENKKLVEKSDEMERTRKFLIEDHNNLYDKHKNYKNATKNYKNLQKLLSKKNKEVEKVTEENNDLSIIIDKLSEKVKMLEYNLKSSEKDNNGLRNTIDSMNSNFNKKEIDLFAGKIIAECHSRNVTDQLISQSKEMEKLKYVVIILYSYHLKNTNKITELEAELMNKNKLISRMVFTSENNQSKISK